MNRRYPAFTLIELLSVIAIIMVMAVLVIPSIGSIGRARSLTDAGDQIASAIEIARSEAISRRTFVWLGMEQSDGTLPSLTLGLVFSKDGSSSTAATNLQPIGRILKLDGVTLASTTSSNGSNVVDITNGASFSIGSNNFTGRSLTFTPMGEITTIAEPQPSDGFTPRLIVPLRLERGTAQDNDNFLDVVIDGSVGIPMIEREP